MKLTDDQRDSLEIQAKKCWLCKEKCFEGEIYIWLWDRIEAEAYHKKMREDFNE